MWHVTHVTHRQSVLEVTDALILIPTPPILRDYLQGVSHTIYEQSRKELVGDA